MKYEDVLFEKEDGVAVLTLDRPDRYNAFSPKMRVSIVRAIDDVANDPETRVLILTGAGKGFCTGFDWMLSGGKLDLSLERPDKIGLGKRYLGAPIGWIALWLRGLTKPTICAVNGVAAGGGLGLALACDILIASEEARFSSAFARRGLVPDSGVTSFLPKLVGRAKALELMWTGDIIDAQEALRIGLVSKVVPHEELMDASKELAHRLAQAAPIAAEFTKQLVDRGLELKSTLEYETYFQNICFQTEDVQEGIKSFLEKRTPVFKGK